MSSKARGFWIAVAATAVGGLIVLIVQITFQYGIFEPASSHRNMPAAATSGNSSTTKSINTTSAPTPDQSALPTAPAIAVPPVVVTPAPLNNTVITSARIVIVGDEVSPGVYKDRDPPGYYATVFTAAGEVGHNSGCYVHWTVYNNGNPIDSSDTSCGLAGGWSTEFWPNSEYFDTGTAEVTAGITTDWGSTAKASVSFQVQ